LFMYQISVPMKPVILKTCLRLVRKLIVLIFTLAFTLTLFGQCLPGTNTANVTWYILEHLVTTGNYSGCLTAAMSRTYAFAIGVNRVVIVYPSTMTTSGENGNHTGDGSSFGTGADVQYSGSGVLSFTFDEEVNNFRFSLYDIDAGQRVNVTAVNALGTALPI